MLLVLLVPSSTSSTVGIRRLDTYSSPLLLVIRRHCRHIETDDRYFIYPLPKVRAQAPPHSLVIDMANAEIDALMAELEGLNVSPDDVDRSGDGLELMIDTNKSKDMEELEELEGVPSSPVCPLKKRVLKLSKDLSPSERSVSPATLGSVDSGDFISPRPPLIPRRKSDRSPGSAAGTSVSGQHTSPSSTSRHGSKGDLFSSEGESENVTADMELELENLLNAGNSSNSSSPSRTKDMKENNSNDSCRPGGALLDIATAGVLNVDDFDDTPRSMDASESVNDDATANVRPPEPEPDAESISREVENALRSPLRDSQQRPPQELDQNAPEDEEIVGGSQRFTPLPSAGILPHANKKKCIKVTLHGSVSAIRGWKESSFARNVCCNNLLCVKCNFSVLVFSDLAWRDNVDYMFFRNSSCDATKLSDKLDVCENHAAYCCQCSWITCEDLELEPTKLGLQWCCAGHVLDPD